MECHGTRLACRSPGRQAVIVAGLAAVLLVLATEVRGQAALSLVGFVRDSTGQPVAGAQVWVQGTALGTVADRRGRYGFALSRWAPRDTLVLHAQSIGYATEHRTIVPAQVTDSARVDFVLAEIDVPLNHDFRVTQAAPPPCTTTGVSESGAAPFGSFSYRLFRELAAQAPDGNVIVSPLSSASALTVAYPGARGATATAFGDVLDAVDSGVLSGQVRELRRALIEQDCVELSIGNAVWHAPDVRFDASYVDHVRDVHDAVIRSIDPLDGAKHINAWAAEQTRGKITRVIADPIREKLLLMNAVYFKGMWAAPFDSAATRRGPFRRARGDTLHVPLMRSRMNTSYLRREGFALARLPYRGDRFAMYILLPDSVGSTELMIRRLQVDSVNTWIQGARHETLDVTLPRFTLRTHNPLKDALTELGLGDAFDARTADLSGMFDRAWLGRERLFISRAVQDVFLEVNEEGTEAAAVTAFGVVVTGVPPPPIPFIVDRPFVLLIRDDSSRTVLFIGQIVDPSPRN